MILAVLLIASMAWAQDAIPVVQSDDLKASAQNFGKSETDQPQAPVIMPSSEQFPCLGVSVLRLCSYNPAQPSPIYFSIGNAIAALGLIVAIQQFLKPLYVFRLRAYRLKIGYFISLVFFGFACAVVAMFLPNLPIPHRTLLEYPIVWEFAGGLMIAIAYGMTSFLSLAPARIYAFNLIPFTRAAGELLSEADDTDRIGFARDLLTSHNIAKLITFASAWKKAEMHSVALEFERLREIGAPPQVSGRPPISAFYEFAHRRELQAGSYAGALLRLISDPHFCSVLVRRCPWLTASILSEISEQRLHADQAEFFIQEIGTQALINDESIVAKEVSYEGFGTAPVLSTSLFRDRFILRTYDPLAKMKFGAGPDDPSPGYVLRLNGASKMMLETAIDGSDYWGAYYMQSVESAYESLFRKLSYRRYRGMPSDFLFNLHLGVLDLSRIAQEGLDALKPERRKSLFISDMNDYRHDLVHVVASIIYKSLESIANRFLGVDDEGWLHAIGIFMEIYPSHSDAHTGMNPLQQQLAVQLIQKLRHNMEGLYPAISRVLLAVIGPYDMHPGITTRTAFVILRDAVYKELQRLPALHSKKPNSIVDFLPPNIIYDPSANTLTHTGSLGSSRVTQLSALRIDDVDLTNQLNWACDDGQALHTGVRD